MVSDLGPIFDNCTHSDPGVIESYYINNQFHLNSQNKFFVELGATNGIIQSNTKTLEDKYDWSGLLIEPNDILFQDLQKKRPNCILKNYLVYNKNNEIVNFQQIRHIEGVGNSEYLGNSKIIDQKQQSPFSVEKATRTLESILDEISAPQIIDFMVIDVENSFFEVLSGMNFNKYDVKFLGVEMSINKNIAASINYLLNHNFKLINCNQSGPDFIFQKI